jgi:hypothetical protein
MSRLTRRIGQFVREDFHAVYYLAVAAIAAVGIYFNYYYGGRGLGAERILFGVQDPFLRLLGFFALYALTYLGCLLLYSIVTKDFSFWARGSFYLRVASIFLLLSLMRTHTSIIVSDLSLRLGLSGASYRFLFTCLSYLVPLVGITAILYLVYRVLDRGRGGFYGLGWRSLGRDLRAFLPVFFILIPLVVLGMLTPGMAEHYPVFRDYGVARLYGLPQWSTVAAFETSYALGFVTIELVFRGFLTIGMARVVGKNAVVPMALVYCVGHLGKPVGECVSSLFGGYFLGVVAYRYRSILIGVLLHVSLAMSMELVSYLARTLPLVSAP